MGYRVSKVVPSNFISAEEERAAMLKRKHRIVTAAFTAALLTYAGQAVAGSSCPWDLTGNGVVDAGDLALLLGSWGSCPGCPADFTGDGMVNAADLALLLGDWGPCPACVPGAGDCCTANNTPGCKDEECCQTVCDSDAFCCDVIWDVGCAQDAGRLCPVLCPSTCGPGAGDCCTENGTPGCEDVPCCQAVCDRDSFCCNVVWDNVCADGAQDLCPDLCGGGTSNCCFAHPFPGCDDPVCEEAVCFTDSFCCNVEWDQTCVDWALLFCPELCG